MLKSLFCDLRQTICSLWKQSFRLITCSIARFTRCRTRTKNGSWKPCGRKNGRLGSRVSTSLNSTQWCPGSWQTMSQPPANMLFCRRQKLQNCATYRMSFDSVMFRGWDFSTAQSPCPHVHCASTVRLLHFMVGKIDDLFFQTIALHCKCVYHRLMVLVLCGPQWPPRLHLSTHSP